MSEIIEAKFGAPDRPLIIGVIEIPCYVLEDGRRVIVQRGLFRALGITRGGSNSKKYKEYGAGARLVSFIDQNNLMSLIDSDIGAMLKSPIVFKFKGTTYYGYEATLLQEIVRAISKAHLKGKLAAKYHDIGANAELLDDAFAKVGIIALVDEATGYQNTRVADELNKFLNKFLLKEAKRYEVTFPLELYKQWFKLNGWEWKPENAQKRTPLVGKYTKNLIYERIAPGVLKELERRNPKNDKGYREHKHFQFLTEEVGTPKLREFFGGLIALSKATSTWRKYMDMVNRVYPRYGDTLMLNYPDIEGED